jgi:hypothetical protein
MAELPWLLLWVETVKVGEKRTIGQVPLAAGIIGHAIVDAADVLMLMRAPLLRAESGGFLE